jgi:hypothetical protein
VAFHIALAAGCLFSLKQPAEAMTSEITSPTVPSCGRPISQQPDETGWSARR